MGTATNTAHSHLPDLFQAPHVPPDPPLVLVVLIIIKKEKNEPLRKRGCRAALPRVLEWGSGIPVPFRYRGPTSCFLSPPADPPPASRASPTHSPPSPLPPPQQLVLFVFPHQLCSGLPEGWMHRWLCLPAQHHHPYLLHIHSLSREGVGEGVRKTKKKESVLRSAHPRDLKISSGSHYPKRTCRPIQCFISYRDLWSHRDILRIPPLHESTKALISEAP